MPNNKCQKGKISKEENVEEEKCRKINTERGKCQN